MNLTPEIRQKIKPAAAGLGLVLAALFLYMRLSGGPSASSGAGPGSRQAANSTDSLIDPTLQLNRLSDEHRVYAGNGRNIFRQGEEPMPTPAFDPRRVDAQNLPPTPIPVVTAPPPPPINLIFYGFASKPGQPKKIFLKDNEDIFVGSEGDVVDRHYKIIHIGTNSTDVEDLLNNNRQTLPLIQSERG